MIRFASTSDHPQLKALWAEAFGDTQAAIGAYFSLRHADENMLVDERDGRIAGMLSMLPVLLEAGNGRLYPARYIYAVATSEAFRRQGVSTALLAAAHTLMKNRGIAASVLAPADGALFSFYEKRGYQTAFYVDRITVTAGALPPLPQEGRHGPCPVADYTRLRNLAFQGGSLFVRWDEAAVAYAEKTLAQPGGFTALSWHTGHGCAAWETADDGILVKELALVCGDAFDAIAVLHRALDADRYTVRMAQGTVPGAAAQPFGMIRWFVSQPRLSGKPPYLSLAMD